MKEILMCYYPVLFLLFFVVSMGVIIKASVNKSSRNKEREEYIKSTNNIDRLMNNKPHTTNEIELVEALRGENIIYRGVK